MFPIIENLGYFNNSRNWEIINKFKPFKEIFLRLITKKGFKNKILFQLKNISVSWDFEDYDRYTKLL